VGLEDQVHLEDQPIRLHQQGLEGLQDLEDLVGQQDLSVVLLVLFLVVQKLWIWVYPS
jgi:hypothetical protein